MALTNGDARGIREVFSKLILKKLYREDVRYRRLTKGKPSPTQLYNIYFATSLPPAEFHPAIWWNMANDLSDVRPIMVHLVARLAARHPETGAERKKLKDNHNTHPAPPRTILTPVCVVFREDRRRNATRCGMIS
jgi:hypothetical protein